VSDKFTSKIPCECGEWFWVGDIMETAQCPKCGIVYILIWGPEAVIVKKIE